MSSALSLQLLHLGGHAATAIATGWLAYWVVFHTELPSRRWFGLWMANFSLWSVVSMGSVVVSHQPTAFILFWLWSLVGIGAVYLTLLFVIAYSGRNPMTNRLCRLSTVLIAVLAILSATGPLHGYYWRSVSFVETPFPHFIVEYGPGWITTVIVSLGVVGVLVYYFAELYFRSRRQQRRAVAVLMVGGLFGVVPVALSHSGVVLIPTYEYYAFTGATQGLAVGYAAIRFGSGPLSTVAREEAIDYLVDPYFAVDTDYRLVDYNEASSELIEGLTVDRIGEPLTAVFPDLAERLTTAGTIAEPDEPLTFVVDGTRRHYSVDISTVEDWQATRCYTVVLNDVTELESARHRVEQQNEQLDAFVGTVSHDLRSPLSVIGGRLKLLETESESEHIDHISTAHGRMAELIDELLTLAREGRAVGDTQFVDLREVSNAAWQSIEAPNATIQITTDCQVLADRSRLQQVIENLLRNSIEHGITDPQPAGDDSTNTQPITVTVGELPDGFYLEDDGIGIPAVDREEIFETGYTTSADGTGFGLAIVSQIIEAHGWTVRATESQTGGARFEITGVEVRASREPDLAEQPLSE